MPVFISLTYFLSSFLSYLFILLFFFFNDTATTEIYTLSLHDALPISFSSTVTVSGLELLSGAKDRFDCCTSLTPLDKSVSHTLTDSLPAIVGDGEEIARDRKSTRLNSSHVRISYAVFCLKKKKILAHL